MARAARGPIIADRVPSKPAAATAAKPATTNRITPVVADRIAKEYIPAPAPTPRSNQGRRPDDWNTTIHNNRNNQTPAATTNTTRSSNPTPLANTSSGSSGGSQSQTQAEPQPIPEPPAPPVYAGVKAAPIDTVVFVDEPYDENFYADVLFEDFGGQEILSVTRSDTVNGQNISYQPFKDLGIIRDQYSPNILLGIQETSDNFFANFLINLNQKGPEVGGGPNGENAYLDQQTGNVIVEFINIEANEQVEIQILNAGIIEDIGI